MKTIAQQYFETLAKSNRLKPYSRKRPVIRAKLSELLHRQMRKENKGSNANG